MTEINLIDANFAKLPATGKRARELGEIYYFTNQKCTKGHLAPRYSSSGNCVQCIADKRGQIEITKLKRFSEANLDNQRLAIEAVESGFTVYKPILPCVNGHFKRFVTNHNCAECNRDVAIKRKEVLKWTRIKKIYGISKTDFFEMLDSQNSMCSICKTELTNSNTHIDHCHSSGSVRSLLCGRCNQGLGLFSESEQILFKAIEYLQRFKSC